jgi:alkanesulfonate monooxygenase SsuD/methylene tetrahydromethanopterin reductase-like flavin-dependent oxidoreductase (luciferase family)
MSDTKCTERLTRDNAAAVLLTDHQVGLYSGIRKLAVLADDLGFDTLWSTEHHFSPYLMMSPLASSTEPATCRDQ